MCAQSKHLHYCKQAIYQLQLWAWESGGCFMDGQRHSQCAPIRLWLEETRITHTHTQCPSLKTTPQKIKPTKTQACTDNCREHKHIHAVATETMICCWLDLWCVSTEANSISCIICEVLHELLIWHPSLYICVHFLTASQPRDNENTVNMSSHDSEKYMWGLRVGRNHFGDKF